MPKQDWYSLILDRRQTGPVQMPNSVEPRLPQLDGIRAVVFDVYGTLFSSGVGDISLATEENRDTAIRRTFETVGLAPTQKSEGIRFDDLLHGIIHQHQDARRTQGVEYPEVDIRDVWKELVAELKKQALVEPAVDCSIDTLAIDYETRVNPTQPMPGLAETLGELKQRGLAMSIISNAQFYTPLLFEAFLGQNIEALGFSAESNVWSYAELEGKPSQKLYRLAKARLKEQHKLSPEDCLYIGNDMRNDIWPAQAIGFKTALFAGDRLSLRLRQDHPACKDIQADAEITTLSQILDII